MDTLFLNQTACWSRTLHGESLHKNISLLLFVVFIQVSMAIDSQSTRMLHC